MSIIRRWARLLVHYSVGVQPGWKVEIRGNPLGEPLLKEVYREVLKAGGFPHMKLGMEALTPLLIGEGSDEQIGYQWPTDREEAKEIDARISIGSSGNPRLLAGLPSDKVALLRKASEPLMEITFDRTNKGEFTWVGTLFPTEAQAKEAGMSLPEFEEFITKAGHMDEEDPVLFWRQFGRAQEQLAQVLNKGKEIHFLAPDTDLKMSVLGRTWIPCSGTLNFPDGEVFSAPIEESVEGEIRYRFPTLYQGVLVEDIRLKFSSGVVVDAQAAKGEEHLLALLDLDEGARTVGEVAIGTNYAIQRHTKNILFDEKIGGTIHLALGRGYPQTGSRNLSALHWDMVLDMRQGGRILLDGETIHENGLFTIPNLNLPGMPSQPSR